MTDGARREAAAFRICETLRRAGFRALLAGGCVRDRLLGVAPKDYDIATSARPEEVAELFNRTVGVGAAFGVMMVLLPEGPFEVATFRKDGPYMDGRHPEHISFSDEETDALRRDFTINALFYDPFKDEIIDYVEGREDLEAGVIRAVGDPRRRFGEDRLRLLRAIRFAARLNFKIAMETQTALRAMAVQVKNTSAERIHDELVKMLTEGGAHTAFTYLDALGFLEHLLPELEAMKGVAQPSEFHPEGDVFEHTIRILEELDRLETRTPALALAALLHDAGKPATQTFEDRIRFNYHDKEGARIAEEVCHRLRCSNDCTRRVVWLVENHMRLMAIVDMKENKRKRFVREPGFDELLALGRLDCAASHGDFSHIEWVERYIAALPPEATRPPRLVTGRDLLEMGIPGGPVMGALLREIEDAQLNGELADRETSLRFAREKWQRGETPELR